jgi:hypothetical protein
VTEQEPEIDLLYKLVGQFAEDSKIRYGESHPTTTSFEKFLAAIAEALRRRVGESAARS